MGPVRRLLRQPLGATLGIAATLVCIAAGVWTVWHALKPSPAIAASTKGLYICAQTGKAFSITITPGITVPVQSPYSGTKTGYPAELCLWTRDGQIRSEGVPVLLNVFIGKRGPTFCPDCGRLVRSRNPRPVPGKPPPTREQYRSGEEE